MFCSTYDHELMNAGKAKANKTYLNPSDMISNWAGFPESHCCLDYATTRYGITHAQNEFRQDRTQPHANLHDSPQLFEMDEGTNICWYLAAEVIVVQSQDGQIRHIAQFGNERSA
jgi:hypothetical protein